MTRSWMHRTFKKQSWPASPGPRRPNPRRRLLLKPLEERQLLSTYTVINTNDAGSGSLPEERAPALVASSSRRSHGFPDQLSHRVTQPYSTLSLVAFLKDLCHNRPVASNER